MFPENNHGSVHPAAESVAEGSDRVERNGRTEIQDGRQLPEDVDGPHPEMYPQVQ
jgi:hypothetical protein